MNKDLPLCFGGQEYKGEKVSRYIVVLECVCVCQAWKMTCAFKIILITFGEKKL